MKRIVAIMLFFITIFIMFMTTFAEGNNENESGKATEFTLTDIDGNEFSLSDFKGKVVVIEFMAVSCAACNEIMPNLRAVYENYEDDIVMISIDVYENEDNVQLREFMNKHKATWIFARDTDKVNVDYDVRVIPKLVIIDSVGQVTYTHEGVLSEDELSREIDGALRLDRSETSGFDVVYLFVIVGISCIIFKKRIRNKKI